MQEKGSPNSLPNSLRSPKINLEIKNVKVSNILAEINNTGL